MRIIRYLVNRGASVDPLPNFFWDDKMVLGEPNQPTPLITTIKSGSIEAARILISLGANLSYANPIKAEVYFPLLSASEECRPDFVKLFVDAGADINEQGWGCWNALTCAVNQGNEPMVRYLVNLGADVNHVIHDDGRDGALGYNTTASKVAETLKMAKLLVSLGADPKLTFPSGNALFDAVAKNNLELVKFFVEAGTPLNEVIDSRVVTDFAGLTALDAAISRNYPAIAAYLKSKGAKSAKK
ncbi:MAG: ankyrin repeat domain-containing protein [Proteobacteria bacterium]|nr:MAG: ankyrin repeat domain-containing protein [Pseudomonadota bacterium]